jgi:exopolysaccharide biosynthesis polyprenyl glycosylphosphotransferase
LAETIDMPRRINWLLGLLTVAVDAVMIITAFLFAYVLRRVTEYPRPLVPRPFSDYAGMLLIHVVALIVTFFLYRLYHFKGGLSRIDKAYSTMAAISFGTVASVGVTAFLYKNELDYPRVMIIYAWAVSIVFVMIGRLVTDQVRAYSRRASPRRVLIVGAGDVGRMILQKINQSPGLGYQTVGFVDDTAGRREVAGVPVLGNTSQLAQVIRDNHVREVIIGLPEAGHEELLELISQCEQEKATVRVFPNLFQIIASEISIDDLNGLPLLTVRDVALRGWRLTLKRAMDLLISTITLVVLSPWMLLTALLIKLDSPGPVFYAQERMGLDARPFQMLKFRSMRADAEKDTGPVWATADDARKTRLGSFLRRYSFDELPQFINVLVGEMSLVGPRPERPVFVEQFRQIVPRYMERHKERAGLTGWAQVNGQRGDTSIVERTKYDLWYIENWSLALDLKIMLKTLFTWFRDRNAY